MQHTCSLGADFPQPNQRAQLAEIEIPNLLQFRNLVSLQLDDYNKFGIYISSNCAFVGLGEVSP